MIEVDRHPEYQHATNGAVDITVLEGKIFQRVGIHKHLKTGQTSETRWVVGELNGVRVYCDGNRIIMTTRDINPEPV